MSVQLPQEGFSVKRERERETIVMRYGSGIRPTLIPTKLERLITNV